MHDISKALQNELDGNSLTCVFPNAIDSLKGSDVNFELVTSSTCRPLRLFYSYNLVHERKFVTFVQTHLKGVGAWSGTEDGKVTKNQDLEYSAAELGAKVLAQMQETL